MSANYPKSRIWFYIGDTHNTAKHRDSEGLDKKKEAIILVAIGTSLFGFLGVLSRYFIVDKGLGSIDVAFLRFSVTAIILFVILFIFARDSLKITKKDVCILALFAICKLTSDVLYLYALSSIPLSLATILQFTSPFYVIVLSLVLFKEKMTTNKIIAISAGTAGMIIVSGILFENMVTEIEGIIAALLSGVCTAIYFTGFKVAAERKIKPSSALFYIMMFGSIISLPFCHHQQILEVLTEPVGIAHTLAIGIFMNLIPYYLVSWSSNHLEATTVSMISMMEIVSASIIGFFLYGEDIAPLDILGMTLVMASIILINIRINIKIKEMRLKPEFDR